MPDPAPDDEIAARETANILGYSNLSSIAKMVYAGKLIPTRKLPGKNGPYLFRRSDVERVAAERRIELEKQLARIGADNTAAAS